MTKCIILTGEYKGLEANVHKGSHGFWTVICNEKILHLRKTQFQIISDDISSDIIYGAINLINF